MPPVLVSYDAGTGGSFLHFINAVIQAKRQHLQIAMVLLLLYHPTERPIEKPKGFDITDYPSNTEKFPHRLAIVRANRDVVD